MRKFVICYSLLVLALCAAGVSYAADFPLSNWGQIQNVQSYSSNPYYNPNSPYNQRLPQPIYAQGTELNAGDCRSVASTLVAQQCAARNNCAGLQLSDIRPAVMIQMSNMSGHNYVTACGGYINAAFDDYKKNANVLGGGVIPAQAGTISFPAAGGGAAQPTSQLAMENPFEREDPQWLKDRIGRQKEMRALQRENGSDDVQLSATQFPTTYADLSFTERMENNKAGYEPWKDAKAYKPIRVEDDKARYEREKEIAELKAAKCAEQVKINPQYIAIEADLKILAECQTKQIKFEDCKKLMRGNY
ncbi:MAG: hypothetical protein FWF97_02525 [Alphaproteobacteria bacterium]|nr:hypothetical protein [Alphaproteobacteria bacterium]